MDGRDTFTHVVDVIGLNIKTTNRLDVNKVAYCFHDDNGRAVLFAIVTSGFFVTYY